MIHPLVIVFIFTAALFALTHAFAVFTSLYWYYWWFDIFMHFWGGLLIGLGVHALSTISLFRLRATTKTVFIITMLTISGWELFERYAGLYDPLIYVIDTSQDLLLGLTGGLLAHGIIRVYRMK